MILNNTASGGYIHIKDKHTLKISSSDNEHLSRSGYSKDELAALQKPAKEYAVSVAAKDNLGVQRYAGVLFDLAVKKERYPLILILRVVSIQY